MRTFPTAVASSLFPLFFFLLPFYTSLYHMFEQIEMNREGDLRERIGDEVAVLLRRQVAEEDGRAQAETYRDVITFHFSSLPYVLDGVKRSCFATKPALNMQEVT
jgi:hypothetical protein